MVNQFCGNQMGHWNDPFIIRNGCVSFFVNVGIKAGKQKKKKTDESWKKTQETGNYIHIKCSNDNN